VAGAGGVPPRPLRQLADPPALSCSIAMSFALLYAVVRFLLEALLTRRQSEVRIAELS